MRRIFAQSRKELTQIIRDWRTLALALLLPIVLLLLMSTALSLTVSDLPIIVQDLDGSAASHDFVDAFRASITFHVVAWPANKQPEEAFTSNVAHAALIIPEHFGRNMARGFDSPLQLLVDASDANTAKLVAGYSSQIAHAFHKQTSGSSRRRPGADGDPALVQPWPFVQEVFCTGHICSGAIHVSAITGFAGHGEGRRAEDHSPGLCFQHFGA